MPRPSLEEIYSKSENAVNSMPVGNSPSPISTTTQSPQFSQPVQTPKETVGKPSLSEIYDKHKQETPQNNPVVSTQVSTPQPEQSSLLGDIGTAAKQTFIDPFTSRFGNIDYNNQGISSNIFQSVGAVAGGVTDVVGKALLEGAKVFTPKSVENAVGSAVDSAAQAVGSAIPEETKQAFADWQQAHPEAAANLGAFVDIASLVPLGKGAGLVKGAINLESKASKLAKAGEIAQRVVQPTKPQLFNPDLAVQAFKDIPTENIKKYSDFAKAIDKQNASDLAQVTKELSKDTTPYRIQDFEINKAGLKFNPVKDAISSLYQIGVDTRNTKLLAELNKFGTVTKDGVKLAKGTMIQNDVNELAKLVGKYQNSFKEAGGILKGDKYIKAENVRTSLKEIARTGMSKDIAELDKKVSSRISLNKRVNDIANKVSREVQSAQKLGAFRKLVKFGINASDLVSGRVVSTVIRELSRNGKLTAVELEKELGKNLKLLQEATKTKDINKMRQFLKGIGYIGGSQAANQINQPEQK